MQLYYKIFIKYAIANHKFPNEYSNVMFIQIDKHLKMLLKNTKGPDFMKHGVEERYIA